MIWWHWEEKLIIIFLRGWAYPSQIRWVSRGVSHDSHRNPFSTSFTSVLWAIETCLGPYQALFYFFSSSKLFPFYYTSSTDCLFVEGYEYISRCRNTFVYSFFLIPLTSILKFLVGINVFIVFFHFCCVWFCFFYFNVISTFVLFCISIWRIYKCYYLVSGDLTKYLP